MTMEMRENTYCIGLWMLAGLSKSPPGMKEVCDFAGIDINTRLPVEHLCSLYRHDTTEPWLFDVRQRIVLDDLVHDSTDKKSFWRVTFVATMSESEARYHAEEFIEKFTAEFDYTMEFQPVYENFGEWLTRRRKQGTLPIWMHVKEVPIDGTD